MTRNPNFANWDGPSFREGRDHPCHVCDASGVIEDGEQIDVDDFRDALCDNCAGTGCEPWRSAGDRDTGDPSRDGLHLGLPRSRRHWSTQQDRARSLRPTFNFRLFDLRAQRILAQRQSREAEAAMLSMADQCVAACERALAEWEKAA